jgi:hypothetical protein
MKKSNGGESDQRTLHACMEIPQANSIPHFTYTKLKRNHKRIERERERERERGINC